MIETFSLTLAITLGLLVVMFIAGAVRGSLAARRDRRRVARVTAREWTVAISIYDRTVRPTKLTHSSSSADLDFIRVLGAVHVQPTYGDAKVHINGPRIDLRDRTINYTVEIVPE